MQAYLALPEALGRRVPVDSLVRWDSQDLLGQLGSKVRLEPVVSPDNGARPDNPERWD